MKPNLQGLRILLIGHDEGREGGRDGVWRGERKGQGFCGGCKGLYEGKVYKMRMLIKESIEVQGTLSLISSRQAGNGSEQVHSGSD